MAGGKVQERAMIELFILCHPGDLSDDAFFPLAQMVSPERWKRALRYHRRRDAQNTVLGEILARKMLARLCGKAPMSLEFQRGEQGKPFLWGEAGLHFNISHTRDCVVCAVSDAPVGVDVESEARHFDMAGLANRFFTSDEARYVFSDENSQTRFLAVWSMKESYLKMLGSGITMPLNSFDVFRLQAENRVYFTPFSCGDAIGGSVCGAYDSIKTAEVTMGEICYE